MRILHHSTGAAVLVASLVLGACGPAPSGEGEGEGEGEAPPDPDFDVVPCDQPEAFPEVIHSDVLPIDLHYQLPEHEAVVRQSLDVLEEAWPAELALGFRAPVGDAGHCGDDERFDVFAWNGLEEMYVDLIDYNEGHQAFMAIDPWGPYGGEQLRSTMFHELNHAMQAVDDWDEPAVIFEATSQAIEVLFVPETDTFAYTWPDFQLHPEWSIDRDDAYETWFMYGAAMLLLYLDEERFADLTPAHAWLGDMWSRSAAPNVDFEDALGAMLADLPQPSTFADEVATFAVWRAVVAPTRGWGAPSLIADPANAQAMAYGTVYAALPVGTPNAVVGGTTPHVTQTFVDADGNSMVAVTVLPPPGAEDAFARTDEMFPVPITFE